MSRLACVLIVCAIAAGCGGSTVSPLAPPVAPSAAVPATASITGSVQTAAGAAAGMNVQVIGTSVRAVVGNDNRFALLGLAAGAHRLHFSGAGANAEIGLDPVAAGEALDIIVNVNGNTATIQSGHKLAVNETRFVARITSLPPDTAAGTFVAGTQTVTTSSSTVIKNGSRTIAFSALALNTLVEVTGVQGDTSFAARLIDALPDPQVHLEGAVAGLEGTAADFRFSVDGRSITGGSATEFKGGSNASFARLANGMSVRVTGDDKGTHVEATRINLPEDPAATPATPAGELTAMSGESPALTLTVGTATVLTDRATLVRRGNAVLTLAALAIGQMLEVEGTLAAGGQSWRQSSRFKRPLPRPLRRPRRRHPRTRLRSRPKGSCQV